MYMVYKMEMKYQLNGRVFIFSPRFSCAQIFVRNCPTTLSLWVDISPYELSPVLNYALHT